MNKIGIVLPGWKDEAESSFQKSCIASSKAGFYNIEIVSGTARNIGAERLCRIASDNNMRINCIHTAISYSDKPCEADYDGIIKRAAELTLETGASAVVCSWIKRGDYLSYDDFKAAVEIFSEYGEFLKKENVTLMYHNHAAEFSKEAGDGFIDIIGAEAGKSFELALDIGWVSYIGYDVRKVADVCKERVKYLHLRDYNGENFTCLGKGDLNILDDLAMFKLDAETAYINAEIPLCEDKWNDEVDFNNVLLSAEFCRSIKV